jgi:transcriptional antiterminator RfaH
MPPLFLISLLSEIQSRWHGMRRRPGCLQTLAGYRVGGTNHLKVLVRSLLYQRMHRCVIDALLSERKEFEESNVTIASMHEAGAHAEVGWLVVNTHPHREEFATANLERQGFQCYCPMTIKRIRHARRAYDGKRPMFPGYIFARFTPTTGRWRCVMSTLGVRSIVLNGHQPGLLPDSFITSLRCREVDGIVRTPPKAFQVGEKVTVQGSPLDGLVGEIIELREKERVLILLDLMQNPVRLQVDANSLRPS